MRKITILIALNWLCIHLLAQPSFFSWQRPETGINIGSNYITPAKDQGEQSPCHIFAAVAAVEALSHIYFNKPFPKNSTTCLDLSEREIYSWCSGFGGPQGSASIEEALNYIDTKGIVDENCFQYPQSHPFYTDCSSKCSIPQIEVDTPGYEQLLLITDQALKCAIIDNGPIAVSMLNCGQDLHGSSVDDLNHSVLIIGWNSNGEWHIKDSWPNKQGIYYKAINVFQSSFMAKFFRVKYENSGSVITCSGSGCSTVFSSRSCVDNDGDGFYNWGIGDKPAGFPGPCKMDFNDADPSKIFLNSNYLEVPTPTVSGSNYGCSSGTTYQLNNLPTGFSASWSVSNPTFFNDSTSGSGTSATLYPKSHYAGDNCVITFTISDGCGSAQYSRSFAINGPEDSEVDINVVAYNAPTPMRVSGVWLLCPNSSYYIYFNNTSNCSTSDYQWIIPSDWTKYEQSSNYIRINTNSSPFGTVNVTATTCCGSGYPVITQNFSQGYCTNPYFSAYPNPATTDATIMFKDAFDLNTVDETTTVEIYDWGFSKKYTAEKIEKELKIKTGGWKSGFYYIILTHKGVKYYEKIMVGK